ncbi:MAG TPA: LysR family transcriptional regulator ArgP [Kineosporiaceae bacterium]|nr:LysR family transcriptional regulator ArgP [Kineosporiaceae bacterium]
MDFDPAQLRALNAAVSEGTFEAAARLLRVTPSAVSQRLKALEIAAGRVLLVRTKPIQVTPSGAVVLRMAREIELLAADTALQLGSEESPGPRLALSLAVNADSLATWVLPALVPLGDSIGLHVHREDEGRTSDLLREGVVMAAITTQARPVPGCRAARLGVMRYRPMSTPDFAARWFPDGVTVAALAEAPVVVFDRNDHLQHRYLRRRSTKALDPPTHQIPSSEGFVTAVRLGLGWAMVPDLQSEYPERKGEVIDLDPRGAIDVVLHWQQWKLRSSSLDRVADVILAAARKQLR